MRITRKHTTGECPTPLVPCKTINDCSPKNFPNMNIKPKCLSLTNGRMVTLRIKFKFLIDQGL